METKAHSSPAPAQKLSQKLAPLPAPAQRSELLLWAGLSAVYAAVIIQYALHYGKLAAPPFYDDVSYFADALGRLRELYGFTWQKLLGGLFSRPPHSVFSTLVALIAYLIFGTHDWAPYAGNAIIILGLAYIINATARGLPCWIRVLLFMIALTLPISQNAIIEFRPDIASALCAGAGAAMIVSRPLSAGTWQFRVVAGVLLGLSMIIKTPTFPLTSMLAVTALGVSVAADLLLSKSKRSVQQLFFLALQPMAAAFLVMLPVYAPQFREIWGYIYDPIFGQSKDLWASHMSRREHALYYLTGEGGQFMLGNHLYQLLGIIIGGFAIALVRRRKDVIVMITGFTLTTLVSYAIPTILKVKQPFFGTTFDWMLIFCAIYVLVWLVRSTNTFFGGTVVTGAAIMMCLTAHFMPKLYNAEGDNLLARRRVVFALYDALNEWKVTQHDRVYITTTGYVNAEVLSYYNRTKLLPPFDLHEQPYSGDLAVHLAEIRRARYVIASEQGNTEAYGGFIPSGNIQDQTLALVRNEPAFAEVAAVPTLNAKRYFLFKRVGPFWGWKPIEGIGPTEGPYPDWKLPEVRWALGPRAILNMPTIETDGDYVIVASCRAAIPGTKMAVRVDGHAVAAQAFPDAKTFAELEIPLHLTAGEHRFELTFTDWSKEPGVPMGVLFKTMKLAPAAWVHPTTQPAVSAAK